MRRTRTKIDGEVTESKGRNRKRCVTTISYRQRKAQTSVYIDD